MQPGGLIRVSFEAVPIEMKSHAHLLAFLHARDEHHGGCSEFLCVIAHSLTGIGVAQRCAI